MKTASKLRFNFQKVLMTIISFYELEFSYDYNYLCILFNDLHTNLRLLIQNHLTDKSLCRINHVFYFCNRKEFLDEIFRKDSVYREIMDKIVNDLNKISDNN